MRETCVQSLGWEDPLEEGMATHSSILTWGIPWMEKHGKGSQRVGHDWATRPHTQHSILLDCKQCHSAVFWLPVSGGKFTLSDKHSSEGNVSFSSACALTFYFSLVLSMICLYIIPLVFFLLELYKGLWNCDSRSLDGWEKLSATVFSYIAPFFTFSIKHIFLCSSWLRW